MERDVLRGAAQVTARRGTSNTNVRGNSKDRAARKAWLMTTWASDTPGFVRCYRCGKLLTGETLTVDRIKPGKDGGRYVRGNIRPSCAKCALETSMLLRFRKLFKGGAPHQDCDCMSCRPP